MGSDGLSSSLLCLPESPKSFPPSLSLRDRSRFPVEADLEETLEIQVDAGVAPESLVEVELPPVPMQRGLVRDDLWPWGGVGLFPSLSKGGENAGCFVR